MKSDLCPHCGESTGIVAEQYMQLIIATCPHCGKHMYSVLDLIKGFLWMKSDRRWEKQEDGSFHLVKIYDE